jgi:hypothetical protein
MLFLLALKKNLFSSQSISSVAGQAVTSSDVSYVNDLFTFIRSARPVTISSGCSGSNLLI